MHSIFNWCVDVLYKIAYVTGLTYEEINVIVFVFIHPAITILLLVFYIRKSRVKKLFNLKH
jgi:hypothetical protein